MSPDGGQPPTDQNTQRNAAMVEEQTTASHKLASEALNALISEFRIGEEEDGRTSVRRAA